MLRQPILRVTFLALCGSLVASSTFAQDSDPNLTWAEKMFDEHTHDFGTVARGAHVSYRLKIKNIYKETAHISNVRTTCGCSAGTPSATTLKSLETGYIEVTMNTNRFTRRKDSNVIVTFDQPLYAEVRIPITAYIRTDVVLTPGGADFGAVDVGATSERKIAITYAGRSDWKIREVKSANPHVTAKVVETARSGGQVAYDLLVTLKDDAPVGALREQITLVTDDSASPHVPIIVEAKIEADITVTPAIVTLGSLTAGKAKKVNVVLRGKKPFEISKLECETDRHQFKVVLPKTEKRVHVLPLTITPSDKVGSLDEEFTVTVAGRKDPVTFSVKGTVTVAQKNDE